MPQQRVPPAVAAHRHHRGCRIVGPAHPVEAFVITSGQCAQHPRQRIGVIVAPIAAMIDNVLAGARGAAFKQTQFANELRMIRDAHRAAHEMRQRFEIKRALVHLAALIG